MQMENHLGLGMGTGDRYGYKRIVSKTDGTVLYPGCGGDYTNLQMWWNCIELYTHTHTHTIGKICVTSVDSTNAICLVVILYYGCP